MGWYKELKETYVIYRERDPAIRTYWDVLLYPCYHALRSYRKANKLWNAGHHWSARLISQRAARKTGIEIHPGATIGKGLFIDHGTGVVIGEVGHLLAGRIDALILPRAQDGMLTAPESGWLTDPERRKLEEATGLKSVPPNCTVVGVPGRVVRMKNQVVPRDDIDQIHLPDPILQDMKVLERVNTELINRMLAVEEEIRRLATEKRGAMPGDERFCESDYLREKKTIKIQPEAERDYEEIDDCVFADYI